MARRRNLLTTGLCKALLTGTALLGLACSSSSKPATGTGGAHGGTTGSGGSTGTGGMVGSGGVPGTGGGSGTGGLLGTGGDTGMGGAGGMVCPTPVYTHTTTFGSIFEGWTIATNSTFSLVPMPAVADAGADAGPDAGGATGSTLELDATSGSPVNGSAKLTIPFTDPNQELLFAQNSSGLNLTGTTITAQIKLDSGLNTSPVNAGQAFLAVKSTSGYIYATGPAVYLDSTAGYITLTLDANAPNPSLPFGYTPCDIREIDVVIRTGATGTYTQAVVHIDTIAISLPAGSDGGSSDAGTDAATDAVTSDASGQ